MEQGFRHRINLSQQGQDAGVIQLGELAILAPFQRCAVERVEASLLARGVVMGRTVAVTRLRHCVEANTGQAFIGGMATVRGKGNAMAAAQRISRLFS
jgi:hypothetical protein